MYNDTPNRLLKSQFLESRVYFNIYKQTLTKHTSLHWHEFFELCLIVKGSGTNVVNGEAHALCRGSMFLLTPADFHEIYPAQGETMEVFNVIFSEEMLSEETFKLIFDNHSNQSVVLNPEETACLETEYGLIWDESRTIRTGNQILVHGALERLLVLFTRNVKLNLDDRTNNAPGSALHQSGIQRALLYIHHHFRDELSLDMVAKQAQLSSNYFSECFSTMTGTPFRAYVQGLRLNFAKSLLSISDLPVTQVCYASGFHTLTHFERAFKSKFECSPNQYRKRMETSDIRKI